MIENFWQAWERVFGIHTREEDITALIFMSLSAAVVLGLIAVLAVHYL